MHADQDPNYGGKQGFRNAPPCNIYWPALEFSCEVQNPSVVTEIIEL